MGKASRRKYEARSKKEIYDLDTYRQFFPNGIEELSVSTTGWIFTLSPALSKRPADSPLFRHRPQRQQLIKATFWPRG